MTVYYIRGDGQVELGQKDFIARGGQGQVFGRDNIVYKLYDDPAQMIPDAKIRELSILGRPDMLIREAEILIPEQILMDKKNRPVGFTMKRAADTWPLSRFFSNDFRKRHNITDDLTIQLVENIRKGISLIHSAGCLIVDGNEFNYLVDKKDRATPYFIDTDSYQTPKFPATAIMPSIRDLHSEKFTELTDWFSFAVISCLLFVGVHPFKGRHPDFKGNDVIARMEANVSIFNPDVHIPPAARNLDKIPSHYRSWFIEMFEKGERKIPPDQAGKMLPAAAGKTFNTGSNITTGGNFIIRHVKTYDSTLIRFQIRAGCRIAQTQNKIFIDEVSYHADPDTEVIFSARKLKPILVTIKDSFLSLVTPQAETETARSGSNLLEPVRFGPIRAKDFIIAENTLYVRYDENLTEIKFDDLKDRITGFVSNTWKIMPNACEVFDGVIYQNVLGKPYLIFPIPTKSREPGRCIISPVAELENVRISDAKHDKGVCILTIHDQNAWHRMVLRFDEAYTGYDCRITSNIDPVSPDFVTLPSGIVISMNDDGAIEIFSCNPATYSINRIEDSMIRTSMRLCKDGGQVHFMKEKSLFQLTMKNR